MDKEESYNEEVDKQKATILKQYAITKCLNSVSVSDSEAENYYNDNKEEFKSGESVKASHILVSNENDANEVIAELNRGSSFEDIAKKSSQCPSKSSGGDLGYFTRGRMVPEFEQAAFLMEKDEISSSPVKTQFGYHIIKLTDKKGPGVLTFEEVKSQIKQQLGGKKQEKLFYSKIGEFKKKYPVNVLI
jgi:peptidyl-prolyl cis-trans isomerase C